MSLARPAVAAAVVLLLVALPGQAAAVCASMPYDGTAPIDEPDVIVFVGTVADTQSYQQNALMRVEEIWQGGPLPEWQALFGVTERDAMLSTSTHFEPGRQYLVVATWDGPMLLNQGCRTNLYSPDIAERAPHDALEPTPASRPDSWGHPEPTPWWILLGLGTAAVTVAAGWGTLMLRRAGGA